MKFAKGTVIATHIVFARRLGDAGEHDWFEVAIGASESSAAHAAKHTLSATGREFEYRIVEVRAEMIEHAKRVVPWEVA